MLGSTERARLDLRAERLNRVEPRGPHRRINPKKKAHRGGDCESGDYRAHGCLDRHGRGGAYHRDDRDGHADTDEAADGGEHRRFHQELRENVAASLRELFATGLYESIEVAGQREGDGVALIFRGTAHTFIGTVSVDGAKLQKADPYEVAAEIRRKSEPILRQAGVL